MPKSFKIKLRTIYTSRKLLAASSFLIGLAFGYFLGLFELHSLISLPEISIQFSWIKISEQLTQIFEKIKPNPTFLSDIAAFEAAIISFLIPLSIEIISKISERYNSDVITRSFENHWENKLLPTFLLIDAVAAIILRFLSDENSNNHLMWKLSAIIVFMLFIFIAFAIWCVIRRIKYFMGNAQSVVNKLYEDAKKSIQ
jgi:hypothetical protein